jgi:hypothetical protein
MKPELGPHKAGFKHNRTEKDSQHSESNQTKHDKKYGNDHRLESWLNAQRSIHGTREREEIEDTWSNFFTVAFAIIALKALELATDHQSSIGREPRSN